ncbi:MAG: flavin reductase family protein [Bacillota bacterium]|jgi:flavin reductase (DIM6/NTAB) family NADH-FMN oxidoreductase RutF
MKHVHHAEYLPQALAQLPAGAFLTVRSGDLLNTMTIGWAVAGRIWNRPVLVVAVRFSRYTYEIISKSDEFTVSFPLDNDLKKELALCGTKSGRDIDKFKECNLTAQPGQVVATPVIGQCALHYECRIIHKQVMEPGLLDLDIDDRFYKDRDYHTLYFGEIVACYRQ